MDASIPPLPTAPSALRWLPWVNLAAAIACVLWMFPSWHIINGMFVDLPAEARPPAAFAYVLTAIPGIAALALLVAGICLFRRRGYVVCLLASAATVLGGPVLLLGIVNIVVLTRPEAKALFGVRRL